MGVPGQRSKLNAGIIALDHRDIHGVEFLDFKSPGVDEVILTSIALTLVEAFVLLVTVLEGRQDGVELDFVLREDGKLVLRAWVELYAKELFAELELLFLSDKEFLSLNIVNGNVEVGQTTNDDKVLAVAREGKADTLKRRVHLEISDDLLAWHLEDLAARLEAALGRSDQPIVVGCRHTAVAVASRAPEERKILFVRACIKNVTAKIQIWTEIETNQNVQASSLV